MKLEKEITVKVNCNYKSLHADLINKGFKIVEEYQVNDIYLAPTLSILILHQFQKFCNHVFL